MDNKLSSIFALTFIFFIALISFWLNQEVKKELLEDAKNLNNAADFYLSNFSSKHMNEAGAIKYIITGKEMKNYKHSEKTLLLQPKFINYENSKPISNISGESGEIKNQGDEIIIKENVILNRLPNNSKKLMSLYTSQLNIVPNEDIVFSKKPVKIIQEPNIEIDGVGMKYDRKENTIKLLSNVKVHYENAQK
jgi:lipopolysaccharide export system protein LptC